MPLVWVTALFAYKAISLRRDLTISSLREAHLHDTDFLEQLTVNRRLEIT